MTLLANTRRLFFELRGRGTTQRFRRTTDIRIIHLGELVERKWDDLRWRGIFAQGAVLMYSVLVMATMPASQNRQKRTLDRCDCLV